MAKFYNITSHILTEGQVIDAKLNLQVEEIVNIPEDLKKIWGQVPPADTPEVEKHLSSVLDWVRDNIKAGDYCLVAGCRTAVAFVDMRLVSLGAKAVESCTERKVRETQNPDGTVTKVAVFEHLRYRIVPL